MKITVQDNDDTTAVFHVHKALLSGRSAYFAALPNFREGEENAVQLKGINIDAFRYVLTWLYQDAIEVLYEDMNTMIRAYAIADRLLMSTLKDIIVDNVQKFCQTNTVGAHNLYVAKELGLPVTNQLIVLLMDMVAYQEAYLENDPSGRWFDPDVEQFIQEGGEIAVEIMWKLRDVLRNAFDAARKGSGTGGNPSWLRGCHYHGHGFGECHRLR